MEPLGNGKNKQTDKPKYTCKICDFVTSRKNNLMVHNSTVKHKKRAGNIVSKQKKNNIYECLSCGKKFKTRSGRWKHRKKCSSLENLQQKLEKAKVKEENLKQQLESANKTIETLAQKTGIQNINTQNNINIYLNENCKDAISLMDFIRGLTFKLYDIDPYCHNSSIESLSKVVVDNLKKLDNTKRPIHCSDKKRMKFYVKDASGWEKDEENKKIDKAIGFANTRHQGAWHKYAEERGLDNATKDDYYLQMNVEMGSWSDDPIKYKKKIKRAIGEITPIKEALKEVD